MAPDPALGGTPADEPPAGRWLRSVRDTGTEPAPADLDRDCSQELESLLAHCQVAAKGMVAAKVPGAVTVVADVAGRIGRPEALSSAVFSGAALGFVKCLAKEMARYRIRVNAVCYGHLEGFPRRAMKAGEKRLMQATGLGGSGSPAALARAIRSTMNGGVHLSNGVSKSLLKGPPRPTAESPLTPRQREILRMIADGWSTKQIAQILRISVKTVETHRAQLMERLGIFDVPGLVRYALRTKLVKL